MLSDGGHRMCWALNTWAGRLVWDTLRLLLTCPSLYLKTDHSALKTADLLNQYLLNE